MEAEAEAEAVEAAKKSTASTSLVSSEDETVDCRVWANSSLTVSNITIALDITDGKIPAFGFVSPALSSQIQMLHLQTLSDILLLVACTRLYIPLCPSVRPSVGLSHLYFFSFFINFIS